MILFINGDDNYRSQQKLIELRQKFFSEIDKSKLNYFNLDAFNFSLDKFQPAINSAPFLAAKKMVVVQNLIKEKSRDKKLQTAVVNFLKKVKDSNKIIIFYENKSFDYKDINKKSAILLSFLSKQKFKYEYPYLKGGALHTWINNYLNKEDLVMDLAAREQLILLTGENTWSLVQELNKLIAYNKGINQNEITLLSVNQLVVGKNDISIFTVVDFIANRKKQQALKLIDEILESGVNEMYLLTMIIRQFRLLIIIKNYQSRGLNASEVSKAAKLSFFVVKKCWNQTNSFSELKLKKVYQSLLEIDKKFKSSNFNIVTLLNLLILSL
jgi:DNA polymerase-3 subunit delta